MINDEVLNNNSDFEYKLSKIEIPDFLKVQAEENNIKKENKSRLNLWEKIKIFFSYFRDDD